MLGDWMAESPEQKNAELERWVRNSLPKALAFARTLCSNEHTAEDLVHDCFCRLLTKRDKYDLVTDGWRLLLRAITNAVIDRHRKLEPTLLESASDNGDSAMNVVPDGHAQEPLQIVMNRELETTIETALNQLTIAQRAALELKSLGLSQAEIAGSLSISENYVGVLLYRAREKMSKLLRSMGV
jgi:RNA polymerase sigma-70 factor, ECF subfamily